MSVSPTNAVSELLAAAKAASWQRFLVCLLDVGRIAGHLTIGSSERSLVVEELAQFLTQLQGIRLPREKEYHATARKLQILAYSQFWESRAIQRMLTGLVRIANGGGYDPDLYEPVPEGVRTYDIITVLRREASEAGLQLGDFLEDVYKNQVRNAFVHSQLYFVGDLICFLNCSPKSRSLRASMKLAEWDAIWAATREFIAAFFPQRLDALKAFRANLPIRVNLPEIGSFRITYDDVQHRWTFMVP